jgi:signal peptidase I
LSDVSRDGRPFDLWLSEQVEAIAIAVAMALVLKFFVIEAYQIPTGSMQPTILGDQRSGIRDRVLADKLCTMLRDPRRWEVMIFRFPHDERRLYVKRIVGLPGEELTIAGGDVWIDGAIARKPDHVNESVLKTIYPAAGGGMDIGRAFLAGPGIEVDGRRADFEPDSRAELTLRRDVRDEFLHGYDPDWGILAPPMVNDHHAVADLELSCRVRIDASDGEFVLTFTSDEGDTRLALPAAGSGRTMRASFDPVGAGTEQLLAEVRERGLPVGTPAEIVARNVDRQLVLWVDGQEWLRRPDDQAGPRTDSPRRALASLALSGGGSIEDVTVRRDIFYLPRISRPTWRIPDDSYFALGDNTQGSHDSRSWELATYELPDRSVTGFWFNADAPDRNPRKLPDGQIAFADVHGDEAVFRESDALNLQRDRTPPREPAPFIHRRYLLGKAMVVFWPIVDPFRWKLIR